MHAFYRLPLLTTLAIMLAGLGAFASTSTEDAEMAKSLSTKSYYHFDTRYPELMTSSDENQEPDVPSLRFSREDELNPVDTLSTLANGLLAPIGNLVTSVLGLGSDSSAANDDAVFNPAQSLQSLLDGTFPKIPGLPQLPILSTIINPIGQLLCSAWDKGKFPIDDQTTYVIPGSPPLTLTGAEVKDLGEGACATFRGTVSSEQKARLSQLLGVKN